VHVVDVGQGDGVVLRLPGGATMLYDCGPPAQPSDNLVTARLRALGMTPGSDLWALVASHGHLDHVGGCEEVLMEYRVAHVAEAWYLGNDAPASYRRFLEQVTAEGAAVHTVAAVGGASRLVPGGALPLPPGAVAAGLRAEVLWPPALDVAWDRIAQRSIAVRFAFGNASLCVQGDLELAQEEALAARLGERGCTAYLVGHHGSRHASGAAWLARMGPQVAVVSSGPNNYGHPTSEALCRVQQAGAATYATQRVGTITLRTTGEGWSVAPDAPETRDYCAPGASFLG
jgi:competence protein ComEC